MAKILNFPFSALRPVPVKRGSLHTILVSVLDARRPKEARWHLQFAVQRAASCRALNGMTDQWARTGSWHKFQVNKTYYLKRFLRDVEDILEDQRVQVKIDGVLVGIRAKFSRRRVLGIA